MSERENLTNVKVKRSQEKCLNFANLAIQEFCDDIELEINDVNTILYACAKTVESKLGVKPKMKKKPDKNKKPKQKIYIEKEIETMRGEMSILSNNLSITFSISSDRQDIFTPGTKRPLSTRTKRMHVWFVWL